jgi:hypothetical protein
VRYVLALALLLTACGKEPPDVAVELAVRNATRTDVVVTPWKGAAAVTVPAFGVAEVRATAPAQPWSFRVADAHGRELHTTELSVDDAASVVVTDTGAAPVTAADGSDLETR